MERIELAVVTACALVLPCAPVIAALDGLPGPCHIRMSGHSRMKRNWFRVGGAQ